MSIISRIRDWIAEKCPCLEDFRELFVDYLTEDADGSGSYTHLDV